MKNTTWGKKETMAMSKEVLGAVLLAMDREVISIKEQHGEKYNSDHEGWAILKEEYEESSENLIMLKERLKAVWQKIRANNLDIDTEIELMRWDAIELACEAVQCAAVCKKWHEGRK
jgi:hypothetical protein